MTYEIVPFDLDDIESLPFIRVDKDSGLFVHDWGDEKEQIEAAVLSVGRGRLRWDQDEEIGSSPPQCRSNDMISGMTLDGERLNCHPCPLKHWTNGPKGRRIKPPCSEVIFVLILDLETSVHGVLACSRTKINTGRRLETFMRQSGFRFPVTLFAYQENRGPMTWFGLNFCRGEPFDTEFTQKIRDMSAVFRPLNLSLMVSYEDRTFSEEEEYTVDLEEEEYTVNLEEEILTANWPRRKRGPAVADQSEKSDMSDFKERVEAMRGPENDYID